MAGANQAGAGCARCILADCWPAAQLGPNAPALGPAAALARQQVARGRPPHGGAAAVAIANGQMEANSTIKWSHQTRHVHSGAIWPPERQLKRRRRLQLAGRLVGTASQLKWRPPIKRRPLRNHKQEATGAAWWAARSSLVQFLAARAFSSSRPAQVGARFYCADRARRNKMR